MTETALMAANRHRLRHLAKQGNRAAITILWLLDRTERLLSLILIANTVINALATALVTALAIAAFGNHQRVITAATAFVAAGAAQAAGGEEVPLTLVFRDGRTWLGPFALAPAPKLF